MCDMDSLTIIKITLALLAAIFLWGLYKSGAISFGISFGDDGDEELRPEVMAFALLMEHRLREKDTERGGNSWQSASAKEIVIPTIAKALHLDSVVRDVHHINLNPTKHAVDLANYCMMIADVSGALDTKADEARDA